MNGLPAMQPRPTLPQPASWSFPAVTERLTDGLRVATCHLPGHPLVSVQIHVDIPVTIDPHGREGLATLLAGSLKEGTRRLSAQAFETAIELLGARVATAAGHGGLRAALSAPADRIPEAVGLLTEALVEPRLADQDVLRLRSQRLDEIASEEADPESRAALLLRPRLWAAGDRRSIPAAGSATTVAGLEPSAVRSLHEQQLRRGGTTLVAVGDLGALDIEALAADLSRRLPDDDRPRRGPVPATPTGGRRAVVFHRPGAVQTALRIGRVGPGRDAAEWPALMVAMHTLGGTLTSRLDAVLREEKGWTYGVRSRRAPMRGASVITHLSGSVQSEVTPEAVDAAWDIMTAYSEDGPTPEETHDTIAYLAGVQPLTYETPRAVASAIAASLANDLPLEHVGSEIAALRTVTPEQAAIVAREQLRLDDAVLVAVGDADLIGAALEGRVGDVEVLDDRD